ncbi:hypothetical protein [Haloechinothrix sp. LS1_15]|uniref:hypothetical protein n=1 Tax=Haloechinothrix sp. LS1_15 TaxID=2652248 RepID=UPI00294483C1|nr:hypothetical protein [Haloechinothrix sp. LS1_15]MDV6013723.1 hypothetical protein [Haloechinothrix sp. LS1_15]
MGEQDAAGGPELPLPQTGEAPVPLGPQQAPSGGAGGGLEDIAFDSEGVQKVIDRLEDIRERLMDAQRDADGLGRVQAPSDPASSSYADTAGKGARAYQACVRKEVAALQELIDEAREMKAERERHEDEVARSLEGQA